MRKKAFNAVVTAWLLASACGQGDSMDVARRAGLGADAGAADGASGATAADRGVGPLPFFAEAPSVYVSKIKNVLVGLPPTDDEVQSVIKDPTRLGGLVDAWMAMPEYQSKMLRFFELAFQQAQFANADFDSTVRPLELGPLGSAQMMKNQRELFARTALGLIGSDTPFNQVMSTRTYMMTTAMKIFFALTDVYQKDNVHNGPADLFAAAHPGLRVSITGGPVPLSETVDPSSPNFMHWSNPSCTPGQAPATVSSVVNIMFGAGVGGAGCSAGSASPVTPADFEDWTPVTVRQPAGGEKTSMFYDLPGLRAARELVLSRPYVSFFTTPAFFVNWMTNTTNQMRVTINQTLIVALGAQVDGSDPTVPSATPGLDAAHAFGACLGCHKTLDPTRSILAATFSWGYGMQPDPAFKSEPGRFIFQGVDQPVTSIYDLAGVLSNHPLLASAWTQKLCYYVNSEPCASDDPEFERLVDGFRSAGYRWNALVKAVVTSSITTHAASTLTATTYGEAVAVSRRDHLCAALGARLGYADICGLDGAQSDSPLPAAALAIVPGLPAEGYGRGSIAPVAPNDPSLFQRAGMENLCEAIAASVIDPKAPPPKAKSWSSAASDAAIADFVSVVAAIPPSDPRATPLKSALTAHFAAAQNTPGVDATSALRSTFTAACLAPSSTAIGL